MQRLTTDDQLEQIWNAAIEAGIAPIRTEDSNGDPFAIFEDWGEVEKIHDLVCHLLPVAVTEHAPTWEHLPEERRPNPAHHIEWAIGEFGFSDEYSTCSNCYVAINTHSYNPDHWWHYEAGEILCGDCTRANVHMQEEYLSYAASKLEEEGQSIMTRLASPDDHGFVCVNSTSAEQYVRDECNPDHPDYDSRLTYADRLWLQRLGKAARLVDPALQIVYVCHGGSNLIFARFDPNANVEFSAMNGNHWEYSDNDDNQAALGYALRLVFAKWVRLQEKTGWSK